MRRLVVVIVLSFLCAPVVSLAAERDQAGMEFFEKKIRPVLIQHCYRCHSQKALKRKRLKGGLLLDSKAGLLKGGDSGPSIIPGKVKESLLIKALHFQNDLEMPPRGKLPAKVIADFEAWVKMGAPDPRDGKLVKVHAGIDLEKGRQFWAFQTPKAGPVPENNNPLWSKTAIDRFLFAKMQEKQVRPVRLASKQQLARRAYFQLIGLPPSPKEMDEFLKDNSPDAYSNLIDRLLASPHYGEKWARHWLDVARYAEDQAHTFAVRKKTSAYQYRDWVIKAFNDDMPFDRFAKLQIAGDLIEDEKTDKFTQLAGLGFLGLGAEYYKNTNAAQAIADELDDRVDTLTRGFLGLTVSCARCHDHKYDPIATRDYYSLAGIFNGSKLVDAPLCRDEKVRAYNEGQSQVRKQRDAINDWFQDKVQGLAQPEFAKIGKYLQAAWRIQTLRKSKVNLSLAKIAKEEQLSEYYLNRWVNFLRSNNAKRTRLLKEWLRKSPTATNAKKYSEVSIPADVQEAAHKVQADFLTIWKEKSGSDERKRSKTKQQLLDNLVRRNPGPFFIDNGRLEREYLSKSELAHLKLLQERLEKVKKAAPKKYDVAHIVRGGGKTMQVYIRGNPKKKGDWAAKGLPPVVTGTRLPTDEKAAKARSYSRLDLANEIASSDNPLTARVIVNRIWQWHFGRGLVGTSSNFGKLGDRPTHPELLDWLTVRFIKSGWSLKWLHREIMLSTAYQLSSAGAAQNEKIDPENLYCWQWSRRRLDVELWRDSLLAVSGQLDRSLGGPTIELDDRNNRRRTVYAKISRHDLDGLLRLFDFPDANVTSAKRTDTTVPQQQLFVLNSNFMVNMAKAFATRVQKEAASDPERIRLAYRLAFGRSPTAQEQALGERFLKLPLGKQGRDQLSRWEQYAQALLATNEFIYLD